MGYSMGARITAFSDGDASGARALRRAGRARHQLGRAASGFAGSRSPMRLEAPSLDRRHRSAGPHVSRALLTRPNRTSRALRRQVSRGSAAGHEPRAGRRHRYPGNLIAVGTKDDGRPARPTSSRRLIPAARRSISRAATTCLAVGDKVYKAGVLELSDPRP